MQGGEKTIFLVEGTDSREHGINWGDRFAQHDAGVQAFLDKVIDSRFKDKVVITPHVYPPSISQLGSPDYWLATYVLVHVCDMIRSGDLNRQCIDNMLILPAQDIYKSCTSLQWCADVLHCPEAVANLPFSIAAAHYPVVACLQLRPHYLPS